jgi:hypothetical protein
MRWQICNSKGDIPHPPQLLTPSLESLYEGSNVAKCVVVGAMSSNKIAHNVVRNVQYLVPFEGIFLHSIIFPLQINLQVCVIATHNAMSF